MCANSPVLLGHGMFMRFLFATSMQHLVRPAGLGIALHSCNLVWLTSHRRASFFWIPDWCVLAQLLPPMGVCIGVCSCTFGGAWVSHCRLKLLYREVCTCIYIYELTKVGSDQRSSTIQYDSKSKHSKRRQTVN